MFVVRIVLDLLALCLVICALALFGLEGLLYLAESDMKLPLGELWYSHLPTGINKTQAIIQRYLSPKIWEDAFVPILLMPAWKGISITGGACLIASAILRQIAAWLHR